MYRCYNNRHCCHQQNMCNNMNDNNQALEDTCLLFEMGTYMIEKEYVYNSIPYLVDAIDLILGSEENNSTDNGNSIDSNISDNNQTSNEDPNTSSNTQNSNNTENNPTTNSTANG